MSDAIHRLFSGRQWHEVHTIDGLRYRMTIQVTPEYKAKLDSALSHAAGQEAPINPAEIDRKLVGGEAVAVVANRFGDPEAFAERELRVLIDIQKLPIGTNFYLTPAQPPASAEVGRKLIDDLNRIAYGYLPDGDGVDTSVALWAEQTLSRMAASSGRKGDEMP